MDETMDMPSEGLGSLGATPDIAAGRKALKEAGIGKYTTDSLDAASEIDPQAVARFRSLIRSLGLGPEAIQTLKDLIDVIEADPSRYQEILADLVKEGVPADLFPATYDPEFFMAMRLALEEASATAQGPAMGMPMQFAMGGPVMSPVSQGIASMGRYGDTMLAHVNPQEAMMLKRMGGAGTINPMTGLREFLSWKSVTKAVGNVFKGVGDAVTGVVNAAKDFVKSDIGRIITTIAIGAFLGPAAASFLGATSTAAVVGISAGLGSFGSGLLAGDGFKSSLKAGLISGGIAYAGTAAFGPTGATEAGSYKGPTTIGDTFDSYKQKLSDLVAPPEPSTVQPIKSPIEQAGGVSQKVGLQQAPAPIVEAGSNLPPPPGTVAQPASGPAPIQAGPAPVPGAPAAPTPTGPVSTATSQAVSDKGVMQLLGEGDITGAAKKAYSYVSPSQIRTEGVSDAVAQVKAKFPGLTDAQILNAPKDSVVGKMISDLSPGLVGQYGPMAGLGIGALALGGGFKQPEQPTASQGVVGWDLIRQYPGTFGLTYGGTGPARSPAPARPTSPMQTAYAPISQNYQMPQPVYAADGGDISYPRKTGHIRGPGTGTSDSIPAMLSDGEFVFTAKAVRNMGNGSRRKGAKRMYKLMKMLEGGAVKKA